jgi:predicted tellurium resistance membrane protein TerC
MDAGANPLVTLVTLTAMEIVLGVDNIVFIAILVAKAPAESRERLRKLGIGLALFIRLGLLFAISWLMGLTATWFTVLGEAISGRDVILLAGGLFLVAKATHEMHSKLEGGEEEPTAPGEAPRPRSTPA